MFRPTFRRLAILHFFLALLLIPSIVCAAGGTVTYVNGAREFKGPLSYKDKEAGITFYVESDGRHVVALNSSGKILWVHDPFVEAGLKPYRNDHPRIIFIGSSAGVKGLKPGKFLGVSFDSTQFGVMDFQTGKFDFHGQD